MVDSAKFNGPWPFAVTRNEKTESVLRPVLSLLLFLPLFGSLSFFIALVNSEILPQATPKSLAVVYSRLRFTDAPVKYSAASMKTYFNKSVTTCAASMSQMTHHTHKLCSRT